MRKAFIILALVFSFSFVWAQESPSPGAREKFREGREPVKSLRDATQEELRARKEEFGRLQEQREKEFKAKVDQSRAKVREEAEKKRAKLKEKLQKVRDEQKKKIVERIEKQLNELNERMTKHFGDVLDRLEKNLVNIKSRTDKTEAKGWDVSAVRVTITAAEQALAAARSAVEAQAGKTYIPTISGEEAKLKLEVGQSRQALHNDIVGVREKVRAAFEAVRRVAVILAQVPRVDEESTSSPAPTEIPSPTPTSTPTP